MGIEPHLSPFNHLPQSNSNILDFKNFPHTHHRSMPLQPQGNPNNSSVYLNMQLSQRLIRLSICLSVCICFFLSVCLPICIGVCLPFSLASVTLLIRPC